MTNIVENVAFDPATGSPCVMRSYDSYANDKSSPTIAGDYYSYILSADKYYSSLGSRTPSDKYLIGNFNANSGNNTSPSNLGITLNSSDPTTCTISKPLCTSNDDSEIQLANKLLEIGDEILIHTTSSNSTPFTSRLFRVTDKSLTNSSGKLIGITLTIEKPYGLPSEIDASMDLPSISNTYIEIVKSNRSNRLGIPAYTILTRVATYNNGNTPVDDAIAWAKDLAIREKYVEALNAFLEVRDASNSENPKEVGTNLFALAGPYLPGFDNFPFVYNGSDVYCTHYNERKYPDATVVMGGSAQDFNLFSLYVVRTSKGTFKEGWGYHKMEYVWEAGKPWITTNPKGFDIPSANISETCAAPNALYAVNDNGKIVISPYHPDIPYFSNAPESKFQFRTTACTTLTTFSTTKVIAYPSSLLQSVVNTGATTFSRSTSTPYAFRPEKSYVFAQKATTEPKSVITRYSSASTMAGNNGTFSVAKHFNFTPGIPNNDWQSVNTITAYSEHGQPLAIRNDLSNYDSYSPTQYLVSASGYSHDFALPSWNAVVRPKSNQVAENLVYYNSFEDNDLSSSELGASSHSGNKSRKIGTSTYIVVPTNVNPSGSMTSFVTEYWTSSVSPPSLTVSSVGTVTPALIARTGEWSLYRGVFSSNSSSPIELTFTTGSSNSCNIDDIRLYPQDAEVTSYAYDATTLRLVAQFDRNHFGTYYQYDAEGKNVRMIVETVKGYKTIYEAQGHILLKDRPTFTEGEGSIMSSSLSGGPSQQMMQAPSSSTSGSRGLRKEKAVQKKASDSHFDMLEFKADPSSRKMKVFGKDADSLVPTLEKIRKKVQLPSEIPSDIRKNTLPGQDSILRFNKPGNIDSLSRDTVKIKHSLKSLLQETEQQKGSFHIKK